MTASCSCGFSSIALPRDVELDSTEIQHTVSFADPQAASQRAPQPTRSLSATDGSRPSGTRFPAEASGFLTKSHNSQETRSERNPDQLSANQTHAPPK